MEPHSNPQNGHSAGHEQKGTTTPAIPLEQDAESTTCSGRRMSIMNMMNSDPPPAPPSPSKAAKPQPSTELASTELPQPIKPSVPESVHHSPALVDSDQFSQAPTAPQIPVSLEGSSLNNDSTNTTSNGHGHLLTSSAAPSTQPLPELESESKPRPTRAGKTFPPPPITPASSSSKTSKPRPSRASGSGSMNPPSKRKRQEVQEDDGWNSDLESPANQSLYSEEIEVYKQSLANRYSILEQEFEAQMKLKEKFVQQKAEVAYTKRFDAVNKRVEWRGRRDDKKRQEVDRRERDREMKRMRGSMDPERDARDIYLKDSMSDSLSFQEEDEDGKLFMREPLEGVSAEVIEFDPLPPPDPQTGLIPISENRAAQLEKAHRQVWSSIACREIPSVHRLSQHSASSKAQYWRRISTVAAREAKRGLTKSNKSNKDILLKTKKTMREMLVFWKKNEKEERELRKKAEKDKLDKAKKEEDLREAKRQARKLNFLITQTELYSHFVGNKLKTNEAEQSEDTASDAKITEASVKDAAAVPTPAPVTGENGAPSTLAELDFDNDDEANLHAHARKNAEDAVNAAKQKAAAFDVAASEERKRNEAAAKSLAIQRGEAVAEPDASNSGEGSSTGLGTGRIKESDLGKVFDSDEMNFQNPTSMGMMDLRQPKMLTCSLKEYQLKGLNWLANLYEQGINGILADEMGLGKTVQSISLMAYLAEVHDIWGPFLVIAPASTLHNWQQEISRFVPSLKALPYWGNVKDRAVLRKFWNRKQISYNKDAPFHILVTSYQMVVTDEKYFQRVKWQYMVLDEAQAIKSSSSNRWKTLLGFHCRNRLLLTGTPVQNSMQELWALLHFIMPSLFDSHDEFSEWFSKDIEGSAGAESKGTLNEHQLRRLHMILKPFMLRRVKKNVQNELGDKIEIDVYCDLSARQRMLYRALRSHVSTAELVEKATSQNDTGMKHLMNLVMQFRKVCNHPELFERADVRTPLSFATFAQSGSLLREGDFLSCPDSISNEIKFRIPKLFVRDGGLFNIPGERSRKGFETHHLDNLMNVWRSSHIQKSLKEEGGKSSFGFLPLMNLSSKDAERTFHGKALERAFLLSQRQNKIKNHEKFIYDDDFAASSIRPLLQIGNVIPSNSGLAPSILQPLNTIAQDYSSYSTLAKPSQKLYLPAVVAPPIRIYADDRPFIETQDRISKDILCSEALYGLGPRDRESEESVRLIQRSLPGLPPIGLLQSSPSNQVPTSPMQVPQMNKLVVDSSKLAKLDELLKELKAGGHRVLLYFQMTKMMDLMEEYLIYRQYKYLRLDGSSKISERRDMVTDWQTKPEIFVFCLSTRAGGLGINLTAADTVIFYDHDWNPSNDSQAMDRAHRLGQTKQVTVYRLITKGTIDERIVKLARDKKEVQDIVVGNKAYSETGMARPQEIVSLLLDDEELAQSMLKKKQDEEAQFSENKADTARAMHARRRLKKAQAAEEAEAEALNWHLEEDEDDFFGAKPPSKMDEEDPSGSAPARKKPGPKPKEKPLPKPKGKPGPKPKANKVSPGKGKATENGDEMMMM